MDSQATEDKLIMAFTISVSGKKIMLTATANPFNLMVFTSIKFGDTFMFEKTHVNQLK